MIRYLYRETTEEETREIDRALICDSQLMAAYNELREMVREIDGTLLEPSNQTVLNILSYSRNTQPKQKV